MVIENSTAFFNPSDNKLGILGGGQLGKMLLQSIMNYGLSVHVLDANPTAPCSSYCRHFTIGNVTDYKAVYNFGKNLDIITIEIENVNVDALVQLEEEGKKVYPQPKVIRLIQDKGLQKDFYKNHDIPTANYVKVANKEALVNYLKPHEHAPIPMVQKLCKSGYDGKGVYMLNLPYTEQVMQKAFDAPSILENKIEHTKELSVLVARNAAGDISTFDVVEMIFKPDANLLSQLICPADISVEIAKAAQEIAQKIATKLEIVGLLAIEFFLTKDNKLLVNEMAPRPHNSGHHTIEGCFTSQFEQHLKAILNLPFGSTELRNKAVITVNLLGCKDSTGDVQYAGIDAISKMEGVYLHLYGKIRTSLNRKMGHVTIVSDSLAAAEDQLTKVRAALRVSSLQAC